MKLKFVSKFNLNNLDIPNSEYFSFVTYSKEKIIDVFYTNTLFQNFSLNFLTGAYRTSIKNYLFYGYYAAGTNYYAYAPSHIGLFDFFGFFTKYDHDLIDKLQNKSTFEPFPLKKMILNDKYFFLVVV